MIPEVVLQVSAQVIGNDTAITVGGLQGQFELNVRIPLIARNLLQSLRLLTATARVFAEKCVDGIEANRAGTDASAGATLAVATALNGAIGYDKATEIVKKATASGRPLREVALEEGVDAKLYDQTIDLRRIARGNSSATAPARLRLLSRASALNSRATTDDGRLGGARVGEEALLVEAFDQPQVGQHFVDRAALEGGGQRVVAQHPDEHPGQLRVGRVDGDVVRQQL